jgi:predicted RNA-binding protein with RPS1 domain
VVKKGEKVKAVVLGVEPQNRRLSLGIKQLQPDVWESFFATHRVGDVVHGKILRTAQFGAFVEIAEGVEGLCHISEAGDPVGAWPLQARTGQLEHDFKIIKINVEEKKVGLSLRIESCFIGENCALSHGKNLGERIAGAPARLYRQIQKLILPLTLTLRHVRRWSVNEERRTADL